MTDGFDSLSNTKVESDSIGISEKLNDESIKKENIEDDGSLRCSLKIEVIDDTAMIDISQVGKSCSRGRRNRKKDHANQIGEKRYVPKRVYSRKELENLRFVAMEEQRKMWVEVYCGLGHTVQKEYDALIHSNNTRIRRHLGKENSPGGLAAKERRKHMKVYTRSGMTYMNLQNTLCSPGH